MMRSRAHGRAAALGLLLCASCSGGGGSSAAVPADPPPAATKLQMGEASPGVVTTVLGVQGGTGPGGQFQVGDTVSVRFTLEKADGSPWGLGEMTFASAMVSGPTYNYQRVLAERTDVVGAARKNPDGSYTYTFDAPLPATYLPPYNDTPAVGAVDGELTGQPLLEGTYTVGLGLGWSYTVDGVPHEDVSEATFDFLLGSAGLQVEPRAEVTQSACNQCHHSVRAHGGRRRNVTTCLMCHTAGAEDLNDPNVAGGTPGVLIDAKVLFHKIHMGRHLPSVNGIGVKGNGKISYNKTPQPYLVVDGDGNVRDFSTVGFPVFPERETKAFVDFGYDSLTPAEKAQEDMMLTGVRSCAVCHGEGSGSGGGHHHGPSPASSGSTAGTAHYDKPSRLACGSCHDDWDFDRPYLTNLALMPPQPDNSECTDCHSGTGGPLATEDSHRLALNDPAENPGLNVILYQASESGVANFDGTVDVGEGVALIFELQDDAGATVDPATLDEVRVIVSGPTSNPQVLVDATIPSASLAFGPLFLLDVPEALSLEYVGDSTAAADVLATSRFPHHDTAGAATTVYVRTATPGAASPLAKQVAPRQNFVDVQDGSAFARDDHVVLDDGVAGAEEYHRVLHVEGDRLWVAPPGLRHAHAPGTAVRAVTLDLKTPGADYALDKWTGTVTELTEFGAGNAVLVSYTASFVVPPTYPAALNDSPDLGEETGDWTGKPIADGTYTATVFASKTITVDFLGTPNTYTVASLPGTADFLVGSATSLEPWGLMQSMDSCNGCHQDLTYHEGRYRSFTTCLACHGAPGAEDRPVYVSANAPPTPGRSVAFRELLHALHSGVLLPSSPKYEVVAEGSGAYPDDFEVRSYETYEFPATRKTANCGMCHEDHSGGHGNHGNTGGPPPSWYDPLPRGHPTAQGAPVQTWRTSCYGCHQDKPSVAHMDANTSLAGVESCSVCHGPGTPAALDMVHEVR